VAPRTTTIAITFHVDGTEVHGDARDAAGARRPFSGWVGLLQALDELVAAPPAPARRAPG
jgi:hypothetical protein